MASAVVKVVGVLGTAQAPAAWGAKALYLSGAIGLAAFCALMLLRVSASTPACLSRQ